PTKRRVTRGTELFLVLQGLLGYTQTSARGSWGGNAVARTVVEELDVTLTATQPVLRLEDVARRFRQGAGEVTALRGVDLSVAPGEFVAIVGKSGAGKSALLHLA